MFVSPAPEQNAPMAPIGTGLKTGQSTVLLQCYLNVVKRQKIDSDLKKVAINVPNSFPVVWNKGRYLLFIRIHV